MKLVRKDLIRWLLLINLIFSILPSLFIYSIVFADSPEMYENVTAGANDGDDIYAGNWAYQTFTTNGTDAAHSIASLRLYMKRFGTPGLVTAGIRTTTNCTYPCCYCEPSDIDIVSGTIDGDTLSTDYNWVEIEMASDTCLSSNTTYAIVVRAPSGDNTNYVNWQETSTDDYPGGNLGISNDGGINWSANCTADKLFQNWGYSCIDIISAKVFSSYVDDDDWLIAIDYKDTYQPYYSAGEDVSSLFYLQLVDGSDILAQTKVPAWGRRPGCIYLAADEVTALTWGDSYVIRIYGDFSPYPYADYTLAGADWRGSDLTLLEAWVRSTAIKIEDYYNTTLTTYVAGKGITLNEDGGVIFDDGIPELSTQCPSCFQIRSTSPRQGQGTYAQTLKTGIAWQTLWGPQVTTALTNAGALFSFDGQTMGAVLAFGFYAAVAVCAFPAGTAVAAIAIPFVILIGAWSTGFISLALLGVVLSLAAFFLIWQFWLKGA